MRSGLFILFFLMALVIGSQAVFAQDAQRSDHRSEYVGQEHREVRTLSDEDIIELLAGGGWGLAKAAELNGVPGPRHVLDMAGELALSETQRERINGLFREMQRQATRLGERYVDRERALNGMFAAREIDNRRLREMLDMIGDLRAELRFVHLSAHLGTLDVLTEEQVARYNELRGYESGDPCESVPEGHDPELWRRHNNCE